jgi:hypothetical protein
MMSGATRDEMSWFSRGIADREGVEDRLERYLRSGSVRPEWCFVAMTPGGRVLARHWWWASPGSSRPFGVDLVSAEERESAVALLRLARDRLELSDAVCELTAPVESREKASNASETLSSWGSILTASGFAFDVARVRVECAMELGVQSGRDRLAFRPARRFDDQLLTRLFEAVAHGSLDHGMVQDRARCGPEREAQERLAAARFYGSEPDWFTVGCTPDGVPVGYVIPVLIDEVAVVAEIGVAHG